MNGGRGEYPVPGNACTGIKVLFTGQYWPGANTLYIARAFEQCGAIVRVMNDTTIWPGWRSGRGRIVRRLLRRHVIEREWNHQLLRLAELFQPDLVYVTNADFCWPKTLEALRKLGLPVMCFYHDVQWKRPASRFSENIARFDLVATTRAWHEAEFFAAGAKAVKVVRFGFDPLVHRPLEISPLTRERYGADITFVGTFENHRARELESLVARDFPWRFRLWGGYWDRLSKGSPLSRFWEGREVQEQEIPAIYASSKIALHWVGWEPEGDDIELRKGDEHNSRTFQIPACGGAIMLAQRTTEHREFFEENVDAVFFSNVEELRQKLTLWLPDAKTSHREAMATAALMRCVREDYTYRPVVKEYLDFFGFPAAPTPAARSAVKAEGSARCP